METPQEWIGVDECAQRVTAGKRGKGRVRAWAAMAAAGLWLALPAAGTAVPEIQADRYLLQADEQIEKRECRAAKEAMDRILELGRQHGLELPEGFYFRYAQVLERVEHYDEAIEFVKRFLTLAGRDGTHFRDALQLLNAAEAAKAAALEAAEAATKRVEAARRSLEAVIAGMEFGRIPAGEFRMGSTSAEADSDERPVTRVRISRAFELGKYEVTQAEWEAVMGSNPSRFDECGPDCPEEGVSWEDSRSSSGG